MCFPKPWCTRLAPEGFGSPHTGRGNLRCRSSALQSSCPRTLRWCATNPNLQPTNLRTGHAAWKRRCFGQIQWCQCGSTTRGGVPRSWRSSLCQSPPAPWRASTRSNLSPPRGAHRLGSTDRPSAPRRPSWPRFRVHWTRRRGTLQCGRCLRGRQEGPSSGGLFGGRSSARRPPTTRFAQTCRHGRSGRW